MPKFTNRLIRETSPYLLQHAHNPVDWFPWGKEAFDIAVKEDKPILVSIGYSSCHWCHVMEKESFEDEATARFMNDHFVNIKVDREERPDVDMIYMEALQAMTGQGGWPLNVFLTPELQPFFGGTYFPPEKRFNMPSWREVLENILHNYQKFRKEITRQAENLTGHLHETSSLSRFIAEGLKDIELVFTREKSAEMVENLMNQADTLNGGFGNAPKFPQSFSLKLLMQHYFFTGNKSVLNHVMLSLDKMSMGGLYDHLGGGFARYTTDSKWIIPHFEKMLYDNALLLDIYAEAFKITGNLWYARVIRQSIEFIQREMMSVEKGFYSALDADSEGVEGKFYTWKEEGIANVLQEEAELFSAYYGVKQEGNHEGENILHIPLKSLEFAAARGLPEEELLQKLELCRQKLFAVREKRIRPETDDKILISWNALMNYTLVNAWKAIGDGHYLQLAEENMAFLLKKFKNSRGGLMHTYKNGTAAIEGFLDDYAFTIRALINLQEATGKTDYLDKALSLTEYVIKEFDDGEEGYFYFTPQGQEDVLVRKKEIYDNATPSGNSIMAWNLCYLGVVFDKPEWRKRAETMVGKLEKLVLKYPSSFGMWGIQFQSLSYGIPEVVVIGENINEFHRNILRIFLPEHVYQSTSSEKPTLPLLANKPVEAASKVYICRNFTCEKPLGSIEEFKKGIRAN